MTAKGNRIGGPPVAEPVYVYPAKRELLRRFTEQQLNGYEIEYVVAATGQEAARLNLPDDCVVLLA
jgi:hypothetical protein